MARAINGLKECCRCKIVKPISEFRKRNRALDGLEYFCKECSKNKYLANRERNLEIDRQGYYRNREKRKAKSAYYRHKNKGLPIPQHILDLLSNKKSFMSHEEAMQHDKERLRTYKQENKELMREKYRQYSKTDNGKEINRLKSLRRRSRVNELSGTITSEDISFLEKLQDRKCAKCGCNNQKLEIDHIVPVALGGSLDINNIQLLCRSCNASKGTKIIRYIPELVYSMEA